MQKSHSGPPGREKPEEARLAPRGNRAELRARAQDSTPKIKPYYYVSGGAPERPRRVRKV